jgi:hypothetical protein
VDLAGVVIDDGLFSVLRTVSVAWSMVSGSGHFTTSVLNPCHA